MIKRLYQFLFFMSLGAAAFLGWHFRKPVTELIGNAIEHSQWGNGSSDQKKPDPVRYQELIDDVAHHRLELVTQYREAKKPQEITRVIREARALLEQQLPAMMRCWLGTDWAMDGTCSTPGSGQIACGYFVSTVLRDAGFAVERFKLAQQASQNIIGTFLPREDMHVRTGKNYDEFLSEVISRGPGIRIVGLDKHVAFLIVEDDFHLRFIHSSGGSPRCVVDEDRENARALKASNYRVTGNLTGNDDVIHHWLLGDAWPTKS